MADGKIVGPTTEIERLRAEVARLEASLKSAQQENEDAKLRAQFIMQDSEEMPTGRTVEIPKCIGYDTTGYHDDGRAILKPRWEKEEVPTYMYKVDMPPVGGMDIKINGMSLQHGMTYELNLHELRMVKDIVYRLRAHEASIHGTNENAYRQPQHAVFSGKAGGRIH